MNRNPQTGEYSGNYRLVESYRNENGRVCHRTMLNAGYLDDLNADQLAVIQKLNTLNPQVYYLAVYFTTSRFVLNKHS